MDLSQLHQIVLGSMREAVYIRDLDMKILYINPASERLTGWTGEEAKGQKCYEVFGDEQARCKEVCPAEKAIAERVQVLHYEGSLKSRSGDIHQTQVSISPICEAARVTGAVVIMEDITRLKELEKTSAKTMVALERETESRKRAQETLKESEARLRALSEHTFEAIFLSEEGICTGQNLAAEKMFGYTTEEALGRHGSEWIAPEDRVLVREYMRLDYAPPYEVMAIRKDGTTFPCEIQGKMVDYQGRLIRVTALRDITERQEGEQALRESERRYRTLFEESIDAVYSVLRDGEITDANASFCKLFGYAREDLIGKNVREFYLDPGDRPKFQKEIEKKGFVKDYEVKFRKRDGTEIDCSLTTSVHFAEGGSIAGYRGILRDLTAQKALHRQLQQAQKMEAVGTLAGGVAHDFNNLLTVVMGFAELLLVERDKNDPEYADLQKILHAAKNGAELVHRLLMLSRKAEPKPVPMNLNKQIVEVERLLRRTIPKMIDIRLDLSPDLPDINADPSQIEQVLMNLAVNGRDAMPNGGKFTMRTEAVSLDKEYCRLHAEASPGEWVVLQVSDTGHGMDEGIVEHIFEPFFTTKEVGLGTGLGLAMVYGIVKQHNGHITVHSEVGKGTTFRVYLPAIPAEEETAVEDSGIMLAFGAETVLLVDDEKFVRELGARILTKHGYIVLQAENGKEALDLFKKEPSQISLVILDLIMPEMSGTECLEELLKIDPRVKVLVSSGYSADTSEKGSLHMGAKGFVSKPFCLKELLRGIRRALDEGSEGGA